MQEFKKYFTQILDAIDFTEDKEEFANEFLKIVFAQAINNLISSLPLERQTDISERIKKVGSNQEESAKMMSEFFSQEQIKDALTESMKQEITNYLETIAPTLSEEQKQRLEKTVLIMSKNVA